MLTDEFWHGPVPIREFYFLFLIGCMKCTNRWVMRNLRARYSKDYVPVAPGDRHDRMDEMIYCMQHGIRSEPFYTGHKKLQKLSRWVLPVQ